ncbi:MAG TPA: hypothetical protein VGB07_28245 [Blastocatellia bacterium]
MILFRQDEQDDPGVNLGRANILHFPFSIWDLSFVIALPTERVCSHCQMPNGNWSMENEKTVDVLPHQLILKHPVHPVLKFYFAASSTAS